MADDIVRDFLRRARRLHPETAPEQWLRLEVELRQVWGGDRVYVARDAPAGKAYSLARRLAAGESVLEAFRSIGVSRTTGYRLLARPWIVW